MQHAAPSPYRAAPSKTGDKEPLGRVFDLNRDAWLVLMVTLGIAVFFHLGAFIRTYLIPVELLDWDRRVAEHVGDHQQIDVRSRPQSPLRGRPEQDHTFE